MIYDMTPCEAVAWISAVNPKNQRDLNIPIRVSDTGYGVRDLSKLKARAFTLLQLRANWGSTEADSDERKHILSYLDRLDIASRYILIKRMVESDGASEAIR